METALYKNKFIIIIISESQIDYILTNRIHLKYIIYSKTIPGEAVLSQHRLVVMGLRARTRKKRQYLERSKSRSNC